MQKKWGYKLPNWVKFQGLSRFWPCDVTWRCHDHYILIRQLRQLAHFFSRTLCNESWGCRTTFAARLWQSLLTIRSVGRSGWRTFYVHTPIPKWPKFTVLSNRRLLIVADLQLEAPTLTILVISYYSDSGFSEYFIHSDFYSLEYTQLGSVTIIFTYIRSSITRCAFHSVR